MECWNAVKVFLKLLPTFLSRCFCDFSQESIQARTQQITALSDAQLTSFPGSTDNVSWWSDRVYGAITSHWSMFVPRGGVMYWLTMPNGKAAWNHLEVRGFDTWAMML